MLCENVHNFFKHNILCHILHKIVKSNQYIVFDYVNKYVNNLKKFSTYPQLCAIYHIFNVANDNFYTVIFFYVLTYFFASVYYCCVVTTAKQFTNRCKRKV